MRKDNIAAPSAPQIARPATPKIKQVADVPRPRVNIPRRAPLPGTAGKQAVAHVAAKRPSNAYEQVLITAQRRAVRQRRQSLAAADPKPAVAENIEPAGRAVESPLRAAAQAADSPTLGRLAAREQDPEARRELLSALLARDDRASVNVFLECVEDPQTSADALACVADARNAPVPTLFQCLRSPRAARRMAAAQVLGRLDQPAVSCELIAMVRRGTYRQEAMIALLSSSEATARQFLADAERDPMLTASLWNAKKLHDNFESGRTEVVPLAPKTNGVYAVPPENERTEFRSAHERLSQTSLPWRS